MTPFKTTFVFIATLVFFGLLAAPSMKADPLFFSNVVALQDGGNTRVDLFSNPDTTILATPQINFLVDVTGILPNGGTDTLMLTYTESGQAPIIQTFAIPLFGSVNPPFTLMASFISLSAGGTNASLVVDLLSSSPDFIVPSGPNAGQSVDSSTYSFKVAPVPEPATLLLFGTGLATLASKARSRRRKKTKI